MYFSLTHPGFWLSLILFIVALISSCYIPGSLIIRHFKLKPGLHWLLSLALGVILLGIQGYIFGYLGWRWLTYGYFGVAAGLWLLTLNQEKARALSLFKALRETSRVQLALLLTILVGSALQLLQVFGTGLRYTTGIGFFGVNAYDGMLHLSFIQAIIRDFPPTQPGAIGLPITNYHYWSDLIMAELARTWQIPIAHSFFQYWPLVIALGTGMAVYLLVETWGGRFWAKFSTLFFLYFGADTGYLLMLLIQRKFSFETSAIDNGATQFLNVPHSFAKFLFLTALIPLTYWAKTKSAKWGWLSVLMLAPIIGFKVYFGMFAAIGLMLVLAWKVLSLLRVELGWRQPLGSALKNTLVHSWPLLAMGLTYAVITLAIFLPPNSNSGGLFWSPLEWPKLFLGREQLNFNEWWLRKQVYDAAGNTKANLVMDALAIAICLIAVYGTRMLGFVPQLHWYKKLPVEMLLFLLPGSLIFTFLGLYTLQSSGLFNVFNFFAVAAVPLALFTGLWISQLLSSRSYWLKALAILIMAATLPRIWYHTSEAVVKYSHFTYEQLYSPAEEAALTFVRNETPSDSLIQSHPENLVDRNTPYVSFFTNRQTFLTGVGMMKSHNQPIAERILQVKEIFDSNTAAQLSGYLKEYEIDYLYLQKKPSQTFKFELEENSLRRVFENEAVLILQPV